MAPMVLGYWKARGITNPIRYMLEYVKADYTEERFDMTQRDAWMQKKKSDPEIAQYDFPNLPFFKEIKPDGSVLRLTQSTAIAKYLAKKFDLVGKTPEEEAKIEMLFCQLADIRDFMKAYNKEDEMLKIRFSDFKEESVGMYDRFSKILGNNKFLGVPNCLTYVDFYFYEVLQAQKVLNPAVFEKYPNLKEYCYRIEELPGLAEYLKSDRFIDWPFFGPFAKKFGYYR